MKFAVARRIAARELRGGLRGFYIFLTCLALGVGAIAAVGSVRAAIEQGLASESSVLLGGDAEIQLTYRFATKDERDWIDSQTLQSSEIVDFRSMVSLSNADQLETALTQVKGIDQAYPLYGTLELTPDLTLKEALATRDGIPGMVAHQSLLDQMNIQIGETVRLGTQDFQLRAVITSEPDGGASGFLLGPRVIVYSKDLAESGLLLEGTLFETRLRLAMPEAADLSKIEAAANTFFSDGAMRWRDRRNATPGISAFIDRLSAFLVLVGLAGMAVGGVGVSSAVRAYLERKTKTIATLKSLGAERSTIFAIYLLQIGVLALIGITIGVVLGGGIPVLLVPFLSDQLPVPVKTGFYARPLIEAAIYGALTALIFTIWPLSKAVEVSPAGLFRDIASKSKLLPAWQYLLVLLILASLLIYVAAAFSGAAKLALWSAFAITVALMFLWLAAWLTQKLAKFLVRSWVAKGRPALRLALAAIAGPGGETASVVLSLGLGLTVLATIGQIDSNLRAVISEELPDRAPAFFVVDIQNTQLAEFTNLITDQGSVEKIDTAPMLRGLITKINGVSAQEVMGDHWVVSEDRGVSYFAEPPARNNIVEGNWWPENYTGPPLMSFSANEAAEIGLKIGDELTVNILGRDLTAKIASFHAVEFSDMAINFVMIWNPAALQNAPHSHLATIYAAEGAEGALTRLITENFPNITPIAVRDAVQQVTDIMAKVAGAIQWGGAVTLLTGLVVLIGAAAAGESKRIYEAAILKTLGATRGRILLSFGLRSAILGLVAGSVAMAAGSIFSWAVLTFILDSAFTFNWQSAVLIVSVGTAATLLAGMAFAMRPLSTKPAKILRNPE